MARTATTRTASVQPRVSAAGADCPCALFPPPRSKCSRWRFAGAAEGASAAAAGASESRVFERLDAPIEQDRRVACLSVANIAAEGSVDDQAALLKLGVVIKLTACLKNDSDLTRVAAAGAPWPVS